MRIPIVSHVAKNKSFPLCILSLKYFFKGGKGGGIDISSAGQEFSSWNLEIV